MIYKPSRFNKIIDIGDKLLIYNSLSGTESLYKISKLRYPAFCESLQIDTEFEYDNDEYRGGEITSINLVIGTFRQRDIMCQQWD